MVLGSALMVVAGFYLYLSRKNQAPRAPAEPVGYQNLPPSEPQNFPVISSSSIPDTEKIVIQSPKGGVSVNNFYKSATEIYSWGAVDVAAREGYKITYINLDDSFLITISLPPVRENIAAAEKEFLSVLGISESAACRLKVQVGVMGQVDPALSGQNIGLSFCR